MIKWGIMATGNIAHKFAATVCAMKGETELVACSSGSLEKAKAFAKELMEKYKKIASVYSNSVCSCEQYALAKFLELSA